MDTYNCATYAVCDNCAEFPCDSASLKLLQSRQENKEELYIYIYLVPSRLNGSCSHFAGTSGMFLSGDLRFPTSCVTYPQGAPQHRIHNPCGN